jgi:F-type H+-transporting ATPase subunit delta
MIGANSAVARRYAKALLELGVDAGTLKSVVAEVNTIADAYLSSGELRAVLDNPLVAHAAKRAILVALAEQAQISTVVKNAVLLLGDRRRLHALPAIAQILKEMGDLREGVLRAEVTTAARLPEEYYARLEKKLEKMTGKHVVIDRHEDPSLIAGVVTRIGDLVIDGSLRARLLEITNALLPN